MADTTRHVLGISGGKESTALAIYMRDRVPNMEYFFCDTGAELKETHEYIDRVEVYLAKKVERLTPSAISTTGCKSLAITCPHRG